MAQMPAWCPSPGAHWCPFARTPLKSWCVVINYRDEKGRNLLHSAAKQGNAEICKALLVHPLFKGLNDTSYVRGLKWSAVHYAAGGGEDRYQDRAEICWMLISQPEFHAEALEIGEQLRDCLRIKRCNQLSRKKVRKEADLKYPVAQAVADAMTQRCHGRYRYIVSGYPESMTVRQEDQ